MKNRIKYNILLHNKPNFDECIKDDYIDQYNVVDKEKYKNIDEGRIYIADSIESPVEWIQELNKYTKEPLNIESYINKSNKAVMMIRYGGKIYSIIYGYGRTMIKDSSITKHFGLRTAINLISDEDIKSLSTLNISDDYVDIQRQALNFVSQNALSINTQSEIIKSIAGKAGKDDEMFGSIQGSDNVQVSVSTDYTILDVLERLSSKYESEDYKINGFEWIDHIQSVQEEDTIYQLEELLKNTIEEQQEINISPNKIINFDKVGGFFIKGMNLGLTKDNFYDEIPSQIFFAYVIEKVDDKIAKLKNSSLYFWNSETEKPEKIANIYDCIFFETNLNGKKYFINNGDWFEIESNYFNEIIDTINSIPKSSINAIPYKKSNENYDEGEYNKEFAAQDYDNYILFDKQNFTGTKWGKSKVEPADIITRNGQFIHIKKGGSSSTLSHLFAQGLVSSRLFKDEKEFRDFIDDKVSEKFESNFSDTIEPEVVFGIIDKRFDKPYEEFLPVFSMINLCQVYKNITNIGYKCSILPIEQEVSKVALSLKEKELLKWIEKNLKQGLTKEQIVKKMPKEFGITDSTFGKKVRNFKTESGYIELCREKKEIKYKWSTHLS